MAEIVRILLHLSEEEQVECEILNPIILGEQIGNKGYVLDVLVLVNGTEKMNLEMQVGSSKALPFPLYDNRLSESLSLIL